MIETERLLLRPLETGDLDVFVALYRDPEAARFIGGVKRRRQVARWLAWRMRQYEKYGYGVMAVIEKASDEVVGRCGPVHWKIEGVDELEVGYGFLRSAWGQGYATEAATAVRDYVFEELGRTRVIAIVAPENVRSARVAEKLGMTHERDVFFFGSMHRLFSVTRP